MKTCMQIVQHLRPGGIESLCLDLVAFAPANERTLIVSLEGELESALAHWPKLNAFRERLIFLDKRPGLQFSCLAKLKHLMQQYQVSAIHSHHIGPLLYGALAAKLAGVPCHLHTEHDAWHLQASKHRWLQRLACWLNQPQLIADADFVAERAKRFLAGKTAFKVIKNGVDCSKFRPQGLCSKPSHQVPIVIGCSGRLEAVKGHAYLLQALALLPKHFHLHIAGDGSERESLMALCQTLDLTPRVSFLGHQEDMTGFYQSLDVFCLPSVNEGYPLAPLEAQACGIPCVLTDVGATKECLSPEIGHLVPPQDPKALSQAITRLHLTSQLLGQIQVSKATREFVLHQGEVRVMTAQYARLRQQQLNQGGRLCGL